MDKKIYAVTGYPILHSKSPIIFNSFFAAKRINAHYTKLIARNIEEAISLSRELGVSGLNITAPFKESVMPYIDQIDEAANIIGGVNTLVFDEQGTIGYNTDHFGVSNTLCLKRKVKCLILGAGGAAKAACYALIAEGHDVFVCNRTAAKAASIAERFNCKSIEISNFKEVVDGVDLIINTLPNEVKLIKDDWFRQEQTIFDAIYKNSVYKKIARKKKLKFHSGEEWLINQAIPAFEIFTKEKINFHEKKIDIGGKPKKRIALIGFMGSGKSTVGEELAKHLGLAFSDTDKLIQAKSQKTIPEIFAENGENYFRAIEKEVLQEVVDSNVQILACGGGLPIEDNNREILRSCFSVVYLHVSPDEALLRTESKNRPLLKKSKEEIQALYNERLGSYLQSSDVVINTMGRSVNEIVKLLYEEINQTFNN